jgi:rod shape-determining protein MreD
MEQHRYSIPIIALFVLGAVFAQTKVPLWFHYASWLDLPLVVTLYFGLSHREPIRGMSVGMLAGLLQDGLSHAPMGMNGLTKTLVGFFASSLSARIEVGHTLIRLLALWCFSMVNLVLLALLERYFFYSHFTWAHYHFVVTPLLNTIIGFPFFLLGDSFRKNE